MVELDFEQTGDVALDHLLQEVQAEVQATYDFLLPDEMVLEAVHNACAFFDLPEVPIVNSEGVCVWPNSAETFSDDVFGFSRSQMMEMGIRGEDSLTLVYTHECAHRALRDYEGIEGKSEELACDFFAGVHASIADIDTEQLADALGQTIGSDTHPAGELRVEAIEYGRSVAEELASQGIPLTFENCVERFEDFLAEHPVYAEVLPSEKTEAFADPVSFGSAYSKEEYVNKAENCYKEADIYTDKANRSESSSDVKHNLDEAKKWRQRGDEYMQKAKYADK